MASRATTFCLKSMANRLRGSSTFTTSTSPKMKAYAPAADHGYIHQDTKPRPVKGEFVPVYVSLGLIMLSTTIGVYTAMHQLKRSPNVYVKKSRRETLPELVEPEKVVEDAEQFIKKSLFRKVAHLQDFDRQEVIPDPIRRDVYAWPEPRAETLKSVGVEVYRTQAARQ